MCSCGRDFIRYVSRRSVWGVGALIVQAVLGRQLVKVLSGCNKMLVSTKGELAVFVLLG